MLNREKEKMYERYAECYRQRQMQELQRQAMQQTQDKEVRNVGWAEIMSDDP